VRLSFSVQHPGEFTDALKAGRQTDMLGTEANPRDLAASTRERNGWQSEAPPRNA